MLPALELRNQIVDKIKNGIETIKQHYKIDLPFPKIRYDKRGTTAGTADYIKWELNFNAVLLKENSTIFIDSTVPHELAHLACVRVYPHTVARGVSKRDIHGQYWQEVMQVLGVESPERCHQYDTTRSAQAKRSRRNIEWMCPQCEATLMLTEYKSAQAEQGRVHHRGCGVKLKRMTPVNKEVTFTVQPTFAQRLGIDVPSLGPIMKPTSKLDICWTIYTESVMKNRSRQEIIKAFISKAQCTPAGANTYYATCKKRFGC